MPLKTLFAILAALLIAPALAGAQESPDSGDVAFEVSTVVVPVVASVTGLNNVLWRTDVLIRNDEPVDREIYIELAAAPERFLLTTLGAGTTMVLTDVVRQTFGLIDTMSPLIVKTIGPSSVTVATIVIPILDQTVGASQPIRLIGATPAGGVHRLGGLLLNEEFRTNIGFVNLGDQETTFTVSLQRLENRSLGVNRVSVAPGRVEQFALQQLFPLISAEEDTFSLIIEVPSYGYVYASVVKNDDSTARLVDASGAQ